MNLYRMVREALPEGRKRGKSSQQGKNIPEIVIVRALTMTENY